MSQEPAGLGHECFFMLSTSIRKVGIPMSKRVLRDTGRMICCRNCTRRRMVKYSCVVQGTKCQLQQRGHIDGVRKQVGARVSYPQMAEARSCAFFAPALPHRTEASNDWEPVPARAMLFNLTHICLLAVLCHDDLFSRWYGLAISSYASGLMDRPSAGDELA